ncbi:MAG TPA: hypothetical protein VK926_08675 [Gaiellaceae bacterium]|nr:hypothetical protein [Gaiellaceae bacterium]
MARAIARGFRISASVSPISLGVTSRRLVPLSRAASQAMSASEITPTSRPASSITGRRWIWARRITVSASAISSEGLHERTPVDITSPIRIWASAWPRV